MYTHIRDEYFKWLVNLVSENRFAKPVYQKLLMRLHSTEFRYSIRRDRDRAEDGADLRYRFALLHDLDIPATLADLDGPCTVLEMMVALAIRGEEQIADDTAYGNRTAQWFWNMVVNMGLGPMTDTMYDEEYVGVTLQRFLTRRYEPDGRGGLFRIRDCDVDLRKVEIWRQFLWYLNTIL